MSKYIEIGPYNESLTYWSDIFGQLTHDGRCIDEDELPAELRLACETIGIYLWVVDIDSHCQLMEYDGKYYIGLSNEYDECFADDMSMTADAIYEAVKRKASEMAELDMFDGTVLIAGHNTASYGSHELIVLMPCDTTYGRFMEIAKWLSENVYSINSATPD